MLCHAANMCFGCLCGALSGHTAPRSVQQLCTEPPATDCTDDAGGTAATIDANDEFCRQGLRLCVRRRLRLRIQSSCAFAAAGPNECC